MLDNHNYRASIELLDPASETPQPRRNSLPSRRFFRPPPRPSRPLAQPAEQPVPLAQASFTGCRRTIAALHSRSMHTRVPSWPYCVGPSGRTVFDEVRLLQPAAACSFAARMSRVSPTGLESTGAAWPLGRLEGCAPNGSGGSSGTRLLAVRAPCSTVTSPHERVSARPPTATPAARWRVASFTTPRETPAMCRRPTGRPRPAGPRPRGRCSVGTGAPRGSAGTSMRSPGERALR